MARVAANRVWQHYFGTGLVSTPENLGVSGARPSNPALMNALAARLASGWDMKGLHRDILVSAAFRQASAPREEGLRIDPSNRLLWRFPLRRLDAESIRDGMLAAAGVLDGKASGPYVPTPRAPDGEVVGFAKITRDLTERKAAQDALLNLIHCKTSGSSSPVSTLRMRSSFQSLPPLLVP